ncbi:MAG: hypothetical protein ACR2MT_07395 [Aurantibacter sp.]
MGSIVDDALVEKFDSLVVVLLIALSIFLFGLELFLKSNKIEGDTIKTRIRNWANGRYFYITFLWGVLTGHFFFGSANPFITSTAWGVVAILVAAVLLALLGRFTQVKVSAKHQLLLLVSGILFGHFFFSMNMNIACM